MEKELSFFVLVKKKKKKLKVKREQNSSRWGH